AAERNFAPSCRGLSIHLPDYTIFPASVQLNMCNITPAMRSLAFLIVIFLACGVTAFAQQKKDRKAKRSNKQTEVNQPTSMDPSYPTMNYVPKSERRSSKLEVTYNAERRYYEQMERVAKARKRAEK